MFFAQGVSVAAGASCALDVQHKPSAGAIVGATYNANVVFNLNVALNPSVNLTGTLFTGLRTYYIHSDHLDSPRSITNSAGQEVWRWDNTDPFGNNIANENPAKLGTFTFNLRFPGQYFDKETGLHYNVNRDYNPAVGRYVESDPIGLRGGINTYTYVEGNPLWDTDPLGLAGGRGERGATGGSSGQNSANKYKHCNEDPSDPNYIICKDHQSGKKIRKPKPADWPNSKAESCPDQSFFSKAADWLHDKLYSPAPEKDPFSDDSKSSGHGSGNSGFGGFPPLVLPIPL
ncbi:MAG: RHS repeat-associated core domain-containing protein [Gallionella sp.]